jgi:hypothetical protein
MFCPKCGQERISADVRYCSRCGFHLGGVDALLAQELALSTPTAVYQSEPSKSSPRRTGTRLGAKLMFISLVIVPVAIGLSAFADSPGPLLIPLTVFLAGLFRAVYAMLFEEKELPPQPPVQLLPRPGAYAPPLPPHYSTPLSTASGRKVTTGEMVSPPSVTENTTRFLEEE